MDADDWVEPVKDWITRKGRDLVGQRDRDRHRRIEAVTLLHNVAATLNQVPDVVEAMNRILPRLTKALGFNTSWVFLLEPDQKTVEHIRATGLPPALSERSRRRLRTGTCYCQDTFLAGDMREAVNIVECSRLRGSSGDKGGLVFHASVPLVANGQRLGILNVASPGRELFGRDVLAVLSAVGQQVAVAIERAHLYRQAARRAALLQSLARATEALAALHRAEDIERAAVTTAVDEFGAQRALVWRFRVGDARGWWEPSALYPASKRKRVPLAAVEPGPIRPGEPGHPGGMLPGLVLPLGDEGSRLGALAVTQSVWDPIAEAVFNSYAEHVALALANAELLAEREEWGAVGERQRLARELHDAVNQQLFSATLTLATAERLLPQRETEAATALAEGRQQVQAALSEMKNLIYQLTPSEPGSESFAARLTALVRGAGVPIDLECDPDAPDLPHSTATALLRIAQEALHNALRHAHASHIAVSWRREPVRREWVLMVADDGVGFSWPPQRGLGFAHMKARAESIGAVLSQESHPTVGTRIVVRYPEGTGLQHGRSRAPVE